LLKKIFFYVIRTFCKMPKNKITTVMLFLSPR
jgi:hypothetical protein